MADFPHRATIDAEGSIDHWTAPDGWRLRRFSLPPGGASPRGSILFQGGRGDIFEKYFEAFDRWQAAGWGVTSFDWRGQGGSGRLGGDPKVGHLADFTPLVRDLHDFWHVWRDATPGPHVVMGHSMGGYLVLRALVEDAIDPDAAVLVAPMLGLHGAPFGVAAMERIARFMTRIGKPDRAAWKSNEKPATLTTRQKLLTHSLERYDQEIAWKLERPEIAIGPPSWAWVTAAFEGTRLLRADPRLATMAVPTLILSPDADKLVDASAGRAIAARLPDTKLVRFGRESAHEILREADPVRNRALAEIDAFLGARAPRA
ncbi:alpha/beta hydrolase [Sphingomonas gilva]|uniref:Alpha/beta hydrolase n=1 Tax=Sphingomonas gilva TaxID=2305907 RepID=A0A396S1U4_9SPHN|nr:alpha/beta hydrolase [Sphingomonas gilva]RHW17345.1 alpha/beta hydrolase [Sphingomonas gilva]